MKQYILIEIESLDKVNVVYIANSKTEMKRFTKALERQGATYQGNPVVVMYEGEVDGE